MSFPTLVSSGFLLNEIALPISSGDVLYSGGGGGTNQTTMVPGMVEAYEGTATDHHELERSLSESGEHRYFATITGEWSNTTNDQGELVWQESADAEIIITSSGSYGIAFRGLTTSNFDGSYSQSDACSSSSGTYHSDTEDEQSVNLSEGYESEIIENWHSDGEGFALVSLVSIASGTGGYHVRHSNESNWRKTSLRESHSGYGCGCGCGCGSGCSYSEYNCEFSHTSSNSFSDDAYDYTANWSWNANDGVSVDIDNVVTGAEGGASADSWHREWAYSNGCVGSMGYDDNNPPPSSDYNETVPYTGWKEGKGQTGGSQSVPDKPGIFPVLYRG